MNWSGRAAVRGSTCCLFIPPAVHEELLRFHGTVPTCCQLQPVQDSVRLRRLRTQADAGEAEAICPALDSGADALLIDDKKGRRLAQAEGLRCLGLPAVLLAARQRGWIDSLARFLALLEQQGHFCRSTTVRQDLLRRAGE